MKQVFSKSQTSLQPIAIIVVILVAGIIAVSLLEQTQSSGEAFAPTSKQITRQPTYDLEITLSTLKDEYPVGEDVDLTDPPNTTLKLQEKRIKYLTRPLNKKSEQNKINEIFSLGEQSEKSGFLEIVHEDKLDNKSEFQYFLIETNGNRFKLYFLATPKIVSGTKIQINGKILENEILSLGYEVLEDNSRSSMTSVGEQRTVVLLVNFQDNPVEPITIQEAWNRVFDENNPNSINSYYKEVSYNKTFLSGNIYGWYSLPYNSADSCYDAIYQAIEVADDDIYFPDYSKIMVVFPDSNCPYAGRAVIGSEWIFTDDGVVTAGWSMINGVENLENAGTGAHEIGHNLGLWHANNWECGNYSIGEWLFGCSSMGYGDVLDIMGGASLRGHFNSLHKERLGFFDQSNILETNQRGTYFIEPIETPSSGVKALKIPTNQGITYSIEYRRPIGTDLTLSNIFGTEIFNGALIHIDFFDESNGGDTQLVDNTPNIENSLDSIFAVLPIGETFYDEQNEVLITVVSLTDDHLEIYLGPLYCGNRVIDIGEECDGQNLNGKTCEDLAYRGGGSLSCTQECKFDVSQCIDPVCGPDHTYNGGNSCTAIITSDPNGTGVVASAESTIAGWDETRHMEIGSYIDPSPPFPPDHQQSIAYYNVHLNSGQPINRIYRNSVSFETSSIPNSAIIDSAEISFWPFPSYYINTHPNSNDFITVVPTTLDNPPSVSREDFDEFNSVDNPLEVSNRFDISEQFNPNSWVVFPLNSSGLENINKTGFSGFGLRGGYDLTNNPNDGQNTGLQVFLTSGASAFLKPSLEIHYTTPPRIKSQIKNNGSSPVTGYLSMEVDKLVDGQYNWETSIIYNSQQTIPANGVLALDTIWNPLGWTPQEAEQYRAYAEFKIGRREWYAEYAFTVTAPPPACSDEIDNDGDGFIDFSRSISSGCEWANINNTDGRNSITEVELEQMLTCVTGSNRPVIPGCENWDRYHDNDVDQSDFAAFMTCYTTPVPEPPDQHCESSTGNFESGVPFQCGDGIDNDNDGTIDFPQDASCVSAQDNTENWPVQCQDRQDNDQDGLTDYPDDPDCANREDDSEQYQTRVFVTSQTFDGALGGIDGAYAKCSIAAQNAGLTGTFKAWISDSNASASQRLSHNNTPYKRLDGVTIAYNWSDLTDGNLMAPINIDENGQLTTGVLGVWTGTKETGAATPINCSDWTDNTSSQTGYIGENQSTSQSWTVLGEQNCDNSFRLYCIEQGQ